MAALTKERHIIVRCPSCGRVLSAYYRQQAAAAKGAQAQWSKTKAVSR